MRGVLGCRALRAYERALSMTGAKTNYASVEAAVERTIADSSPNMRKATETATLAPLAPQSLPVMHAGASGGQRLELSA